MTRMYRFALIVSLLFGAALQLGCPFVKPQGLPQLTSHWPAYFWSPGMHGRGSIWPDAVALAKNGDILLAGSYMESRLANAWPGLFLARITPQGEQLWMHGGPVQTVSGSAWFIEEADDGTLSVVCGVHLYGINHADYRVARIVTRRYTADGEFLDTHTIDLGPRIAIASLARTPDGGLIVAEDEYSGVSLAKLNSQGIQEWSTPFTNDNGIDFEAVTVVNDGYVAVGSQGIAGDALDSDGWIVKVDLQGNPVWTRTHALDFRTAYASVMPALDGGYIVGGLIQDESDTYRDTVAVKTNAQGEIQWSRDFDDASSVWDGTRVYAMPQGGYAVFNRSADNAVWHLNNAGEVEGSSALPRSLIVRATRIDTGGGLLLAGHYVVPTPNAHAGLFYTGSLVEYTSPAFIVRLDENGDIPE